MSKRSPPDHSDDPLAKRPASDTGLMAPPTIRPPPSTAPWNALAVARTSRPSPRTPNPVSTPLPAASPYANWQTPVGRNLNRAHVNFVDSRTTEDRRHVELGKEGFQQRCEIYKGHFESRGLEKDHLNRPNVSSRWQAVLSHAEAVGISRQTQSLKFCETACVPQPLASPMSSIWLEAYPSALMVPERCVDVPESKCSSVLTLPWLSTPISCLLAKWNLQQ